MKKIVKFEFSIYGVVCHDREPCKNGRTDRDAVWNVDLGGPNKLCMRQGCRSPYKWTILRGEVAAHCDSLPWPVTCAKRLNRSRCSLWYWVRWDQGTI